ncbi:alpha/beta hydrolase [uncultured Tenacibaculum sp.]|uniref:alpha/beta hydrolase family protein n=1 Tax=uncultured Tenacibaculum sp. TaxID=174713 RepID=UPI002619FB7C|nr:alpha/beta hydrolase [uncultured Tenacibaculum sp.]
MMKVFEITTPLGHAISLTEFSSNSNKNKVVLICSATGVLQGYYQKFASFLSSKEITAYTFDYAGIGASKKDNLKAFDISLTNWAINDINSVLHYIKEKHPEAQIDCVCHSIGGQILGLTPANKYINNVVLVASQSVYFKHWKGFGRLQMYLNWHVIFPIFTTVFGYLPSKKITGMENLPKSMAQEFASWGRKKDYLFHYKKKEELYHHQINGKVTSYSTDNDTFAPKKAIDWMTKKYFNAEIIRKHLTPKNYNVDNIGHFGFFKSKFKDNLWNEFLLDLEV